MSNDIPGPAMKRAKSRNGILEGSTAPQGRSNDAKALRMYVQAALAARQKGAASAPAYTNFVKELQALRRKLEAGHDDAAEFSLVCLVNALTACVTSLRDSAHDAVLTAVLSTPLWSCTQAVRRAVLELIVELLVASALFIPNCLQVLIFNLLPPPGSPPLAPDERGAAWEPPSLAVEVQADVVSAMEQAVLLVPALPSRLLPMLIANIPHKLRDRQTQCLYARALLLLAEGRVASALREPLLLGLVEQLLSIDADIKWEDIVETPMAYDEDASSEEEQDDIFELEGMCELDISGGHQAVHYGGCDGDGAAHAQHQHATANGAAEAAAAPALWQLQDGFHDPSAFTGRRAHGGSGGAAAAGAASAALTVTAAAAARPSGKGRPPVDETADKMDSLMELLLAHLQRRVDAGQLGAAWATMLAAFERTLLHAHRCKFTQFLLFFLASKEPERCCTSFATALLSTLRDARQPPVTRSACASYLCSFLARCAAAPRGLVLDVMRKLAASAAEYAANATAAGPAAVLLSSGGNRGAAAAATRHQTFYATVQALLYLLCYHMQPLLASHAGELTAGGSWMSRSGYAAGAAGAADLAEGVRQLVRTQVLPLLSHPLAPLAVCAQPVTHEFVRQAQQLGLADADWEAAAIAAVAQHQAAAAAAVAASAAVVVGGDGGGGGSTGCGVGDAGRPPQLRPLEAFFPFDPYLLRRSSRFLSLPSTYVCFSHGRPHASAHVDAAAGAGGAVGDSDSDAGAAGGSDDDEQGAGVGGGGAAARGDSDSADEHDDVRSGADDEDDDDDSSSSSSSSDDSEAGSSRMGSLDPSHIGAGSGLRAPAPDGAAVGRGLTPAAARSRSGLVPVGLAAAAARAAGLGAGGAAAGGAGGLSGPSPPADMMATSLAGGAAAFLAGMSYGSGGISGGGTASSYQAASAMGMSPYGLSPPVFGGAHARISAPGGAGVSPSMGGSPMAMSLTPHEAGYMQAVPSQLRAAGR